MRAYRPYGAAESVLYAKDTEVLLHGPAGTGKSRAILEKAHILCEKYAGCRGLIVRKTRESLSETALVTFETKVVPEGHKILTGIQRNTRQHYHYPNGSEIIVGGCDKIEKIMSSEYDWIYAQEAIELTENDWESLTTRLRNGVIPYQQMLADTNPDTPYHWLKQRCDREVTRGLESRHEDNPRLYDHAKGEWTAEGIAYLSKLDALTGPRKARLRYGKWVAAEGQIYEEWDRPVHIVDSIPEIVTWIWTIDFGFTNPFVWQEWGLDDDGNAYRVQEIYKTQTLVEDHARRILTLSPRAPSMIICDHDAEGRATLERHLKMKTHAAIKSVTEGIQAVQSRLKVVNGKPRIMFLRDGRKGRDESLADDSKPTCTEEEFDGYVWDPSKKKGEQPLKENDHGMDATRYLIMQLDMRRKRTATPPSRGAWY